MSGPLISNLFKSFLILFISYITDKGYRAVRVSCGLHHTLMIAMPLFAVRTFTTTVWACGWGEHGRLGLSHEEGVWEPTQVQFPLPFHATEISAGEQHSLAAGRQGAYAWGNNSMGQLGVGSSINNEFSPIPVKIPLPEGMQISKIAAGGRHSAAITACGRILSWGWGEEGQLGHGTERNAQLPRPCRLPKVCGLQGTPMAISLGQCHTVAILRNSMYTTPLPSPSKQKTAPPLPAPSPIVLRTPVVEPEPLPEPEPEQILIPEPEPITLPEPEPELPVVGIRELLRSRESARPRSPSPEPTPAPILPLPVPLILPEKSEYIWVLTNESTENAENAVNGQITIHFQNPSDANEEDMEGEVLYYYTLDGTDPSPDTSSNGSDMLPSVRIASEGEGISLQGPGEIEVRVVAVHALSRRPHSTVAFKSYAISLPPPELEPEPEPEPEAESEPEPEAEPEN